MRETREPPAAPSDVRVIVDVVPGTNPRTQPAIRRDRPRPDGLTPRLEPLYVYIALTRGLVGYEVLKRLRDPPAPATLPLSVPANASAYDCGKFSLASDVGYARRREN